MVHELDQQLRLVPYGSLFGQVDFVQLCSCGWRARSSNHRLVQRLGTYHFLGVPDEVIAK